MLTLKKVTKVFGPQTVLKDVSFEVKPGEFVCVTGPSGAGKSSLLHLLIGAEDVTSGTIEVDGVNLRAVPPAALQLYRRRVGMVFQDYKLLPHLTVAENIAYPLELTGMADAAIAKRVAEVLSQMGLTKIANKLPSALSGGEKARTAIARAIVHKPMIVLADEPTGNVDPKQSEAIMKLFQEIHKKGTTVFLATHDAGLVDALQPRVLRLEDGVLVRDSAGGYAHAKKSKTTRHSETPHHIFHEEEPSSNDDDSPPKRRRVHITAIHS